MTSSIDLPINLNRGSNVHHSNVNNNHILNERWAYSSIRKQNRSARRSVISTSSALALLAFLFFLNMLQRSLDDHKQQGPMVMTHTTTMPSTKPRNDLTENKWPSLITKIHDNILVSKFENFFKKYLK